MGPELSDSLQAVADAVGGFLAEHLPIPDQDAARRAFQTALAARGWSVPQWPAPWGGGLPPDEALLVDLALSRAGAPMLDPFTVDLAGPLLMRLADATVCGRWLPAMARGEVRICAHASLYDDPSLAGRFEGGTFRSAEGQARVLNADGAQALMAVAAGDGNAALVLAPLEPARVSRGLPLEPATVRLQGLEFEVLADLPSIALLREAVEALCRPAEGRSGTGRLRHLLDCLERDGWDQGDGSPELADLEISLSGLEALEMRVLGSPPGPERERLRTVVAVRAAELGRALVEKRIEGLGYYALAAPDPLRQHNELPEPALAAQGAEAELIRYLLTDVTGQRNLLVRFLELGGERQK